ncbi:CRISPR-associated protein Cas4 [Azospirillum sp. YIM B02556]|uniref:CRISPR-associated exonuclease Cas4 n=1 Tax=Azospirillum endophyticum TaxID=2800326 RepID=A0ABS1F4U9_9PROT|nr:CRISPR-associated protein Cas4 [Azospirillum endophyticum]MBK1838445.1 CRISPR-associated protein Cas4 [Azospirillum endophyticum]
MDEDDLLPLSALQHQLFCPRQCALIHVERQWRENAFTVEGRLLHDAVDAGGRERRGAVRTVRSMPLRSRRLGLAGIADLVELHGPDQRPYPVEYKRGRPKAHRADEVQLCAQAICLEEMFRTEIAEGALFYGENRRRVAVRLDAELRGLTERTAAAVRAMFESGQTPPPVYEAAKCRNCSMIELCRPRRLGRPPPVAGWLARQLEDGEDAMPPDSHKEIGHGQTDRGDS